MIIQDLFDVEYATTDSSGTFFNLGGTVRPSTLTNGLVSENLKS